MPPACISRRASRAKMVRRSRPIGTGCLAWWERPATRATLAWSTRRLTAKPKFRAWWRNSDRQSARLRVEPALRESDLLKIARLPTGIERRPLRTVDPEIGEPVFPWRGLDPLPLMAFRRRWTEVEFGGLARGVFEFEHRAKRGLLLIGRDLRPRARIVHGDRPEKAGRYRQGHCELVTLAAIEICVRAVARTQPVE